MFHYLIIMNVEVKRKLVYGCLLIMVAVGMMSFSYDMTGEQEANVQEDKVVAFPVLKDTADIRQAGVEERCIM